MKAIDQEQLQNMLTRVCESTLEDQAIEETGYSNLRMAVITARAFGRPVLNWVIFGVRKKRMTGQDCSALNP